ncbi:KISc [Musa troglodytarum]|uniref:KISc n=1 Tax=Musa troglodytarum TaxID=320322 RepID=A0A9E7KZY1_9LILI|nr:KISc [Musa troglodytarum]
MADGRRTKEEPCRVSVRDDRLAFEAIRAASWLESIVGPLGLPPQPTEKEFVSCLTSGIVLCNAINRIQPGAVPKVVARQSVGTAWDIQPLPAYQYFENVRNFLVAVEDLKLPSFEASDLERFSSQNCRLHPCLEKIFMNSSNLTERMDPGNMSNLDGSTVFWSIEGRSFSLRDQSTLP